MTPRELSEEEMTTFRKNTRLQNSVFLNKLPFCSSKNWCDEEDHKMLFNMAKTRLEISPDYDYVAFNFDFADQLAFYGMWRHILVDYANTKKCQASQSALPAPEFLRTKQLIKSFKGFKSFFQSVFLALILQRQTE